MHSPGLAYFFEHLITREAAYSALLERNRRLLHRAAADIYTTRLRPGSPEEWEALPPLCSHLRAAGEYAEAFQRCCDLLLMMAQAGSYKLWEGIHSSAVECLQRSLGATASQRARLMHCEGSRAYAEGRFAEALPLLNEALALAQDAQEQALIGALLTALGSLHQRTGAMAVAEEYFERALAVLAQLGNLASQCQVERSLAILKRDSSDPRSAQRHSCRALELAQACGDMRLEAQVRIALGNESKMYRSFREAGGHMARGYELARAIGDTDTQSACLAGLAEVHLLQGLLAETEAEAREALALAKAAGNPRSISFSLNILGGALIYLGDLEQADNTLHKSLEVSGRAGYSWGQVLTYQYLGRLPRQSGDLRLACEYERRCVQLATQLGHPKFAGGMEIRSVEWLVEVGDLSVARDTIEGRWESISDLGIAWRSLPLLVLVRLLLAEGRIADAEAELESWRADCSEFEPYPDALAFRELAQAQTYVKAARLKMPPAQ